MSDWIELILDKETSSTFEIEEVFYQWGDEIFKQDSIVKVSGETIGKVITPDSEAKFYLLNPKTNNYWGLSIALDGLALEVEKLLVNEIITLVSEASEWQVAYESASRPPFQVSNNDIEELKTELFRAFYSMHSKNQPSRDQIIKLILLPGMDGTGKLFEPLLTYLPPSIDAEVIALSSLSSNCIRSQAEEIAELIGNQEVIIFAESYSGSIAYELAQMNFINIKHIIFVASFLSRPSVLSKFGPIAPLGVLRLNVVPSFLLSWLFFGSCKRNDLVKLFMHALNLVTNNTLKSRLRAIASLTEPKEPITVPCTYIQATKDKLVNPNSITVFQNLCVNLKTEKVVGGHFIAQCNPKKCADIILTVSNL